MRLLTLLAVLWAGSALAADVVTFNRNLPNGAHPVLVGHRVADRVIDAVAFTPNNEWIIVAGSHVDASPGFPAAAKAKVQQYVNSGRRIDAIAFDPAGRYVIVAEDWRWYSHNTYLTSHGVRAAVDGLLAQNKRVDSISFDPDGTGWVVVGDHRVQSRWAGNSWLRRYENQVVAGDLPIHHLTFSPDGGYVGLADDHVHTRETPPELRERIAAYRSAGRRIDAVVFTPTGGWTVISNGSRALNQLNAATFFEYTLQRTENGTTTDIWTRMDELGLPGVAIAYINNGVVQWARGYGAQTAGDEWSVSNFTPFQTASISKTVAAVAALQFVERGELDLDWDIFGVDGNNFNANGLVGQWIDTHAATIASRQAQNDHLGFVWRKATLTPGELLTHTGGTGPRGYGGTPRANPVQSLAQVLDEVDLINTASRYSGGGFMLLQAMMEELSGESFETYAAREVLRPAGSAYATFDANVGPSWMLKYTTAGHDENGAVMVTAPGRRYDQQAAGGMFSNVSDLANFLNHMLAISRTNNPLQGGVLTPATARSATTQRNGGRYGWGFRVYRQGTNDVHFQHGGTTFGFRAHYVGLPEQGRGLVVLTNGELGKIFANELLGVADRVLGWPTVTGAGVGDSDCDNFQAKVEARTGLVDAPCR